MYEDCDYITSTVTIAEYLIYPFHQQKHKKHLLILSYSVDMDIEIKSIDKTIAEKAAQIRAEYKFFKTMDALQLATACLSECDLFLMNDKQLKQFKEINCITVVELD